MYSNLLDDMRLAVSAFTSIDPSERWENRMGGGVRDKMWRCLVEAFCQYSYYFSVDELLLLCILADVSVDSVDEI